MKRDMDLARQILLEVEKTPYQGKPGFSLTLKDISKEELDYHIMLLQEAGLVEATGTTYQSGNVKWRIKRLTWEGHKFLDSARNTGTWNEAKRVIQDKGGNLTFDVLKAVLAQLARQAVGL